MLAYNFTVSHGRNVGNSIGLHFASLIIVVAVPSLILYGCIILRNVAKILAGTTGPQPVGQAQSLELIRAHRITLIATLLRLPFVLLAAFMLYRIVMMVFVRHHV